MAVTPIKYYVPTSIDTIFSEATVSIKNLANGAEASSAEVNNSTALDLWGDLVIAAMWAVAPTAGVIAFEVYLMPVVDGTNYPALGADGLPQKALLVGVLESRLPSITVLEYLVLRRISLPPSKFKILISNTSAQATHATDITMVGKLQRYQMGSGSA